MELLEIDIVKWKYIIIDIIKKNSAKRLGIAFNNHWQRKRKLSKKMTSIKLDNFYKSIIKNGNFYGGKLIGAGGGGFLMFYASDREKLRKKMLQNRLEEVRFNFDFQGTQIILS